MLSNELEAIPSKFVFDEAVIRESEVIHKLMQLDYENLQLKKRDEMLGGFISRISPKNQFVGDGEIDVTGLKVHF
jgi:hypothetical protein